MKILPKRLQYRFTGAFTDKTEQTNKFNEWNTKMDTLYSRNTLQIDSATLEKINKALKDNLETISTTNERAVQLIHEFNQDVTKMNENIEIIKKSIFGDDKSAESLWVYHKGNKEWSESMKIKDMKEIEKSLNKEMNAQVALNESIRASLELLPQQRDNFNTARDQYISVINIDKWQALNAFVGTKRLLQQNLEDVAGFIRSLDVTRTNVHNKLLSQNNFRVNKN